jgi:hypothetical protein
LKTDNRFATHPVSSSVKRVSGDHKHVSPITGNAAVPPNPTADRCCGPRKNARWVVGIDAHNPAMISLAITRVAGVAHIDDPIHQSQCTALFLYPGFKGHAVVSGGRVDVHGPARGRFSSVHVQRVNEMLYGCAVDQCVKEKSPRDEIDNGRTGDAYGINVAARKAGARH